MQTDAVPFVPQAAQQLSRQTSAQPQSCRWLASSENMRTSARQVANGVVWFQGILPVSDLLAPAQSLRYSRLNLVLNW